MNDAEIIIDQIKMLMGFEESRHNKLDRQLESIDGRVTALDKKIDDLREWRANKTGFIAGITFVTSILTTALGFVIAHFVGK